MRRMDKYYKVHYLPGLDGIRAISVIAIIIYHLNNQWLSGGFLGVDTFFVISGYLITSLLFNEFNNTNSINLLNFWNKRIKRLLPALIFLLITTSIYTALFERNILIDIKKDVFSALIYMSNWWYISQEIDYFNQFSIKPLKHLWSLAIEEQFYLFYPLILSLLFKLFRIKKTIQTLFIISIISLILMVVLNNLGISKSRLYFGTDTRLQTLLLGCLFSFIWPPFKLKKNLPTKASLIIDFIGAISLGFLIYLFFVINDSSTWLYNGGFYIISLSTLLLIGSSVFSSNMLSKIMGNRIFLYIGKRSYSLYLWHYPIITFVHSHFVNGQIPIIAYLFDILLILIMTEVSYRLVETPIRKKGIRCFKIKLPSYRGLIKLAFLLLLLSSVLIVYSGFLDVRTKHEKKYEFHKNNVDKSNRKQISKKPIPDSKNNQNFPKNWSPLLIGDSIMVDIGEEFNKKVPNSIIDGVVGRQLVDSLDLVKSKYPTYSQKGKDIIIELGTNGDYTEEQLNQFIDSLKPANIYFVNTRIPRDYEGHVNKIMKDVSSSNKNVYLIDWYKVSQGHTEYFAYDGVHLEYKGIKKLTNLIIERVREREMKR